MARLIRLVPFCYRFIRKHGYVNFVNECICQLMDTFYESYLNIKTKGYLLPEELGIDNKESVAYIPLPYLHIFKLMRRIPLNKKNSTLLDFGCGKGRVLACGASLGFQKVIGVELSRLLQEAEINLAEMNHRKTLDIELIHDDAQNFMIPFEVNLIYFYNPFTGKVLENVTKKILKSFHKHPRKIYIIFFNDEEFDRLVCDQPWIRKIYQRNFYSNTSGSIYETVGQ